MNHNQQVILSIALALFTFSKLVQFLTEYLNRESKLGTFTELIGFTNMLIFTIVTLK